MILKSQEYSRKIVRNKLYEKYIPTQKTTKNSRACNLLKI